MESIEICRKLYRCRNATPEEQKLMALQHMQTKSNRYSIYTDGSKSENGTAFAAYSREESISYSLPKETTIFTAELLAILYATKILKNRNEQHYTIYSDSQSAIEALNAYVTKNHIINLIKTNFHHLQRSNKSVILCWVPSHVGIHGNEKADAMAKQAVTRPRCRESIPPTDYMQALNHSAKENWQRKWEETQNNKLREIKDNIGRSENVTMERKTDR